MKIGYFCNSTNWNHRPYNQILEEIRDIALYCDCLLYTSDAADE